MSDLHWGPFLNEVSHSQYLLIQGNRAYGIVRTCLNCQYDCHCTIKGPRHQQMWSEYYDFIGIWRLMQVPITYAWSEYVHQPETLKHCHKYMRNKKLWESADPWPKLRNMKQSSQTCNKERLKVNCFISDLSWKCYELRSMRYPAINVVNRQTNKINKDENLACTVPRR